MDLTEQQPKAKIAPARKLISKQRELLAGYEGKHIALLVSGFREHTFDGEKEPTTLAEVTVVDVDATPVRLIASLSISWRRVVGALLLTERGTWQVGKLERDGNAVEFLPPDPTLDIERVGSELGTLELQSGAPRPELTAGEVDATGTNPHFGRASFEATQGDAGV